MTAEPTACPFCNALVPQTANAQAGQRVACPRCGETFSLRGDGIQRPPAVTATPNASVPAMTMSAPALSAPARSYNRRVAAAVLTTMILMAAVGLAYALVTQSQRRANDLNLERTHKRLIFPEPADDSSASIVVPSKLEGIGFLPSNTNLVLGVNVARLRQSVTGRKLLNEPIKTGKGDIPLANLLRWTGLEIEELDHLVLGVRTENVEFPRVVVVVRTRRPIDRRRVQSKLDAEEREGPHKGQVIYRFKIPNLAPEAKLWFAEDKRTLVIDLFGAFEGVPEEPRTGLAHLPFAVSEALNERIDPGSIVWLAASIEDWEKTTKSGWFKLAQTFLGGVTPDVLDRLKSLRAVAIGTQLDGEAKAQAAFHCHDAASAKALRSVVVGPGDAEPPGVKAKLAGEWLTVQWTGNLEAVLRTLAR